jgi:dihydroneopterin aldolase
MLHVVKLGGSLLDQPDILRRWLRTVADGGGRLVVVPGGGPFADAVRIAQGKLGFDDRTAHRMALLAMEQCGLLFASYEPALVPASSMEVICESLQRGRVPLWMPFRTVVDAEDIEESWHVTSDSLAAWLARELGATALWLVKAGPIPIESPVALAAMGVVDAAFPRLCAAALYAVRVVGPADASRLAECLATPPVSPVGGAAS